MFNILPLFDEDKSLVALGCLKSTEYLFPEKKQSTIKQFSQPNQSENQSIGAAAKEQSVKPQD